MASLVEKYGWWEWLCHTNFSFLTGASSPADYVERGLSLGYQGMGVTDFDGVYGIVRAYRRLKMAREDGLRQSFGLAYGAEIHLAKEHDLPVCARDTLVLVARSRDGYRELCEVLSHAHRDGKRDAWVPLEFLLSRPLSDVLCLQPMRGVVRRAGEHEARWSALREHFGKRFHFVVSRHLHPTEDAWIPRVMGWAKKWDVATVFSQDAFFSEPAAKSLSDLVQAVRLNLTLDEAVPHFFANSQRSLQPLPWLERRYASLAHAEKSFKAGRILAESLQFDLKELSYHYPKTMIPDGLTAQDYLERQVWLGARDRYGEALPEKVGSILRHELALVASLGFADYFLTVWDIVRWAKSQGILCQGRGSAANSAVCYVLGITAIDPSHFDLLFERFISVERGDPPDIDVDFEHERREEVIRYIYERYGRSHAAMVANVITLRSRGARRAVAKALGIPEDEKERSAVLPHILGLWEAYTEKLRGFPRHLGIHSGGFMLADQPITTLVPQEPATMPGRTVIQWSKEDIEDLGFFKIDVLCLGMLTAIRKCLSLIAEHEGVRLSLETIPSDDQPTYAMIQKADTVGTFQIESRAQMSMLPRLRPEKFYDLVVEVAIIRPGPIQGGMIHPYLKRRHGFEKPFFPDERIRPILERTFGVPIFQEQVMRIAVAVGGFTPGEANELRRNMGSFSFKGDMNRWMKKFTDGLQSSGLPQPFIEGLLGQIRGFSEYGFPESHAASFALLAYASSYLKCHHAAAFFTALLNSQPMGFYAPDTLLKTARRLGVEVLPLCARHSLWDHQLERVGRDETGKAIFGIRLGFRIVRGLSEAAARRLVTQRAEKGLSERLLDVVRDVRLSRLDLTALAAANVFQSWGLARREALWLAEAAPFAELLEAGDLAAPFKPETPWESVQADYHATSTSLGLHPAALMKDHSWCFPVPLAHIKTSKDLLSMTRRQTVDVFGMVLVRQAPPTAKGMMFMTFEDETGMVNLVFHPQTRERFGHLIDGQAFLCVSGVVERGEGVINVIAKTVHAPLVASEVIPLAPLQDTREEFTRARNYT